MASLFDKARVAVLGKMHSLMDKVANTPEAYKQRIRDLEAALADLRAAVDEAVGNANGYKRQIAKIEDDKATKLADIDLLLGDDDPANDEAALELQMELEESDAQLDQVRQLLTEAEKNHETLDKAVDQLEDKRREMVNGLNRITLNAAATKAQNRASSAAEAALSATDSVDAASIDSIEANVMRDRDKANARFDRVIGNLDSGSSPEKAAQLARAKAALAVRRNEIAAKAAQGTPKVEAPAAT